MSRTKCTTWRWSISSWETTWRPKSKATDFILNKNTYCLDQVIEETGNRVFFYLKVGPDGAFVCQELMHIPSNPQVPPEWLSKWKKSHLTLWSFWFRKLYLGSCLVFNKMSSVISFTLMQTICQWQSLGSFQWCEQVTLVWKSNQTSYQTSSQ